MSMLMRRMMWPKQGEEIAIYRNGALLTEGRVNYVDEWSVSVITPGSTSSDGCRRTDARDRRQDHRRQEEDDGSIALDLRTLG
jgi:hypothetical protein